MESAGGHEHDYSTEYFAEHTETGEVFDINDPRYQSVEGVLRTGMYRHYKSTPDDLKYYTVEKVVVDTETDIHLVIYRPLYETNDKLVKARPLDMFMESVAVGKGKIPQFHYIGQGV